MTSVAELALLFKGDTKALDGSLDSTSGKLGKLGQVIAGAGIGAAAGKAAEAVVGIGTAFDDAYDGMAIATGKTGAELEALEESFRTVAGSVPVSFDEASAAVTAVSVRLGDTGGDVDALAIQMANLSRITGTDVKTNVDAAADALNLFGVPAGEQSGAIDALFAASQQAGVSFDQMAGDVAKAAPQFDMLGLSLDQGAGFMATLGKAGLEAGPIMKGMTKFAADGGKAFTDLDSAMTQQAKAAKAVTDAEEAVAAALEQHGAGSAEAVAAAQGLTNAQGFLAESDRLVATAQDAATASQGPMLEGMSAALQQMKDMGPGADQTAMAMELFGKKAGPELLLALNGGLIGVDDLTAGLANMGPGINDTAASTDDMQQKFDLLKNKVMLAAEGFAPLGMSIAPFASMLPMMGGAIGAVAPMITGTLIPAITGMASSALAAVPGVLALAAPFLPIIIAVGLVVAAVAGLKYAWDNDLGGIQEKTAAVVAFLQGVWEDVKAKIGELVAAAAAKFEEMKSAIGAKVEAIRAWIQEKWDAIKAHLSAVIENIRVGISQGWDRIKEYLVTKLTEIRDSIQEKWDAAKALIDDALTRILGSVLLKWLEIKTTINQKIDEIKASIGEKWDAIKGWIDDKLTAILGSILLKWLEIKTGIERKLDDIRTAVGQKWDEIKGWIDNKLTAIIGGILLKWLEIRTGIERKMDELKTALGGKWDEIKAAIEAKVSDFLAIGGRIVSGIRSGIEDAWGRLVEWFTGLFGDLIGIAKRILGIASPSTVFAGIGRDIVRGLAEGIEGASYMVQDAIAAVAREAITFGRQLPALFGTLGTAGGAEMTPSSHWWTGGLATAGTAGIGLQTPSYSSTSAGAILDLGKSAKALGDAVGDLSRSIIDWRGASMELIGGQRATAGSFETLLEHIQRAPWGRETGGGLAQWARQQGYDEETVAGITDLHTMRGPKGWKTDWARELFRRRQMPRQSTGGISGIIPGELPFGLEPNPIAPVPSGTGGLTRPGSPVVTLAGPVMVRATDPLPVAGTMEGKFDVTDKIVVQFFVGAREISAISDEVIRKLEGKFKLIPSPGIP